MAEIKVKRLELILRDMFDAGVDAASNADTAADLRAWRPVIVADCMKFIQERGYLKVRRARSRPQNTQGRLQ